MSLSTLHDQLAGQLASDGGLVLRTAFVPALDDALGALLLTALPLRTAAVALDDDALVVTGTGDVLALHGVQLELRFTGDDASALAFTVTTPAGWALAHSFAGLPPSFKADAALPGLASLQPSLLYDLALTDVRLGVTAGGGAATRLGLAAKTALPAGYDHLSSTLGFGGALDVAGAITLNAAGPPHVDLALTAEGASASVGVGPFHLQAPSLHLRTRVGGDDVDVTALEVEGDLVFGEAGGDGAPPPTLRITADYRADTGAFRFTGTAADHQLTLERGAEALAALAHVDASVLTLPDPLGQLAKVYLSEVDVAFDTKKGQVRHLGFALGADVAWPIIPGFLEVTGLSTGWLFHYPFSAKPAVSGSIGGTLALGSADPKAYFDITAHRDFGYSIDGELRDGSVIDLPRLAESALGFHADLPTLQIDSLGIEATSAGDFRLQGSVASTWGVTIDHRTFTIERVSFELAKEGDAKTGQVYGQFDLAGSRLYVRAAFDAATGQTTGFDFEGGTLPTGSPISLTAVVSALLEMFGASLPSSAPDITLKNLDVAFNTATKQFTFKGETDTEIEVPFLSGDDAKIHATVDLTSSVDSATGKRQLAGLMEGDLTIGSSVFKLQYTMGQATHVMTASWTSTSSTDLLGFDTLVEALGLSTDLEIPHDLDLNLKQVYFEYQVETGTLKLVADSATYGEAFFITSNFSLDSPAAGGGSPPASGTERGYVFGLALDASKISQVPVIGEGLEEADVFHFEELGLVISSADFKGFTVPQLPALPPVGGNGAPSATPAPRKPVAADTTLKLDKGITVVGIVDLASSEQNGQMQALQKVSPQSRLTVTASWAASQGTFTLAAVLDGKVTIAEGFTLGNAGLSFIFADGVTFEVYGSLGLMLDHRRIDVTPRLAISMEEVEFEVDVEFEDGGWPEPFGIKGLALDEAGFEMGVTFEPPGVNFGLEGMAHIGTAQPKTDAFAVVLEMVEEVPDPLLLAFYIQQLSVDEALTTFAPEVDTSGIPQLVKDITFRDVSFFWSESVVDLPDGSKALPGLSFSGGVQVLGFDAYAAFAMSQVTGMQGMLETSPIHLGNVLSVTGRGAGVYQTQRGNKPIRPAVIPKPDEPAGNRVEIVPPGGPVFQFRTTQSPYLYVSLIASLFDTVNAEVEALVTNDGLLFKLDVGVSDVVRAELDVTLNKDRFEVHSVFGLHLKADLGPIVILGVDFGTIHLDAGFDLEMDMAVSSAGFHLAVSGDFEFEGARLTLPTLTIDVAPSSLAKLPELLIEHIKDNLEEIFADLFDAAKKFFEDAGKEIAHAAEEAAHEVAQIAQEAADAAAKVAHEAEQAVEHAAEEVAAETQRVLDEAKHIADEAVHEVEQIGEAAVQAVEQIGHQIEQVVAEAAHEIEAIGAQIAHEAEVVEQAVEKFAADAVAEVEAIGHAIDQEVQQILGQAAQAAQAVYDAAKQVVDALAQKAQELWNEVKDLAAAAERALEEAANAVAHAAESAWNTIKKY